jgi:hypothetical protein
MKFPQFVTTTTARPVVRALRQACLAAALTGVLASPLAIAGQRLVNVEQCLESATDLVALPEKAAGAVTASECASCETQRFDIVPETRYYIGDEPVSYARLKAVASARPMSLYVFYQTGTRNLTRLRLDAGADGTRQ